MKYKYHLYHRLRSMEQSHYGNSGCRQLTQVWEAFQSFLPCHSLRKEYVRGLFRKNSFLLCRKRALFHVREGKRQILYFLQADQALSSCLRCQRISSVLLPECRKTDSRFYTQVSLPKNVQEHFRGSRMGLPFQQSFYRSYRK